MKYIHVNSMLELPESARDQTFEGEEKSSIQMLMKIWNIFFSLRYLLPRQLNIESKKKTTKMLVFICLDDFRNKHSFNSIRTLAN